MNFSNCLIVGHRGWPARFPDNTLAGFMAASAVCDAVELDVRRSGDGKLVLAHDPTLAGFTVSSSPWARMAEADLGWGHHPSLLDEVLGSLPDMPVQIEVKNNPEESGFEPDHRLALEAAQRARPGDIVTSFNRGTVAAIHRVFPDLTTGLVVGPFDELEGSIEHCISAGHRAMVAHHSLIGDGIESAKDEGLEVYTWTVDDPARAGELAEMGVSGIITNDPGLIAGILGSGT